MLYVIWQNTVSLGNGVSSWHQSSLWKTSLWLAWNKNYIHYVFHMAKYSYSQIIFQSPSPFPFDYHYFALLKSLNNMQPFISKEKSCMCFFRINPFSCKKWSAEFSLKPSTVLSRWCFRTSSKAIFRIFCGQILFLINPIKICKMTVIFFFLILILKSFKYNSYKYRSVLWPPLLFWQNVL